MSRFEGEKEHLLSKLKEQESLTGEIQRETNVINTNLSRKNEELLRLERDHENNVNRLKDLNDMLESLSS